MSCDRREIKQEKNSGKLYSLAERNNVPSVIKNSGINLTTPTRTFSISFPKIINELSEPGLEREIHKAYTILDVADNQRLQTLDMTYQRVPLLCDESPSERVNNKHAGIPKTSLRMSGYLLKILVFSAVFLLLIDFLSFSLFSPSTLRCYPFGVR